MSDNNVTVEKVEEELFKIVQGTTVSPSEVESVMARVEAAKLLLQQLEDRSETYTFDDSHIRKD